MKTFIYFICTCFISTGVYFATLNSHHVALGIIIAMAMWAWFFWGWNRRMKKADERRGKYRR